MAIEGRIRLKFATGRTITLTLGEYEGLRKIFGSRVYYDGMQGMWHNWPCGTSTYFVGDNPDFQPKITCEGN